MYTYIYKCICVYMFLNKSINLGVKLQGQVEEDCTASGSRLESGRPKGLGCNVSAIWKEKC